MLVNAGFMREGVRAHNRLARRDSDARNVTQKFAAAVNLLGVHAGVGVVNVLAYAEIHHDFFQTGVPGAFADSVYGAFHLRRARLNAGQRVGDRKPQIVVAVYGNVRVLDTLHVFAEIGYQRGHFLRHGVADGIGYV